MSDTRKVTGKVGSRELDLIRRAGPAKTQEVPKENGRSARDLETQSLAELKPGEEKEASRRGKRGCEMGKPTHPE